MPSRFAALRAGLLGGVALSALLASGGVGAQVYGGTPVQIDRSVLNQQPAAPQPDAQQRLASGRSVPYRTGAGYDQSAPAGGPAPGAAQPAGGVVAAYNPYYAAQAAAPPRQETAPVAQRPAPAPTAGASLPSPRSAAPPPSAAPGPAAAPVVSGVVAAYNPWRQPGAVQPPAVLQPYGAYEEPTSHLPAPPPGPIRSRLLAVAERGDRSGGPVRIGSGAPVQLNPMPAAPAAEASPPPAPSAPTPTPLQPPRTAATPPAPTPLPQVAARQPEPPPAPTTPPAAAPPAPTPPVVATPAPAPTPEPPKPATPPVAATPPAPPVAAPAPPAPPTPPPPQQAAAPSPPPAPALRSELPTGRVAQLPFAAPSAALGAEAQAELDKIVAANPLNGNRRLQVIGYASGDPQNVSAQRRLSLARALAVKNYLVERGMPADRIDVRGLGAASEGGPADRAEVLVIGGNGRAAPATQR